VKGRRGGLSMKIMGGHKIAELETGLKEKRQG